MASDPDRMRTDAERQTVPSGGPGGTRQIQRTPYRLPDAGEVHGHSVWQTRAQYESTRIPDDLWFQTSIEFGCDEMRRGSVRVILHRVARSLGA